MGFRDLTVYRNVIYLFYLKLLDCCEIYLKKNSKPCNLIDIMDHQNCCADIVIDKYSERLKVCGHPVRLKILCLIEKEEACVMELWKCLNQSQPVVSQHLAVLKEKGIVDSDVQGNKRYYSIVDPFIKKIVQSLGTL